MMSDLEFSIVASGRTECRGRTLRNYFVSFSSGSFSLTLGVDLTSKRPTRGRSVSTVAREGKRVIGRLTLRKEERFCIRRKPVR